MTSATEELSIKKQSNGKILPQQENDGVPGLKRTIEKAYGLKVTPSVPGNEKGQILAFQPGSPLQVMAPITSPEITLCRSFGQWIGHFFWIVYAITVMMVCANVGFSDGVYGGGPSCANGKNAVMCQLKDNLEENMAEFRFLIAFLLAGFVSRVILMWYERRKNYAALCGATRELTIMINSFLPINVHEDESIKSARFRLSRWVMLAYELAVLKPQNHMDDSVGKEYLTRRGLLRGREWETMVPGDRHTTVYFWIQTHLVQLERSGHLNPLYVQSISQSITKGRAQANDLMSCLDRDLPFPYVNVCCILVTLNVLIFSTFKGVLWSTWLFSMGDNMVTNPKFWLDVLATFAWNLSYTSLYQLSYALYNPFGEGKMSVPHSLIGGGIQRLSFQLAGVKGRLPMEITRKQPEKVASFEQQRVRKLSRDTPSGLLIITEDAPSPPVSVADSRDVANLAFL